MRSSSSRGGHRHEGLGQIYGQGLDDDGRLRDRDLSLWLLRKAIDKYATRSRQNVHEKKRKEKVGREWRTMG
jgi:hypothetical protein